MRLSCPVCGQTKQSMAIILGLLFTVFPLKTQLYAQGISTIFQNLEWSARGTMLFFPDGSGNASAPMPILPSLGVGASYSLNNLLAMELSLDLYGTTYDYDFTLKRAVPANDEFRSAFVAGAILGFQPVYHFHPRGDKFTIRAYGGLGLDLRMIFPAYGIKDNAAHQDGYTVGEARKKISSYFWGGRFVFPFIGGGMDFPILAGLDLGFDLRLWVPIWRVWSGESLSFSDGFRFGIGFRLGFK